VSPIRNTDGKVIGASKIARDISDRKRADALAERSHRQATFLAQISAALTSTRNFEETLKTIAGLAVPNIADWCAIDVVRHDGSIARLAVAHSDPAMIALAERLHGRYQSSESPNSPSYVIRTGNPALIPTISDAMIVASAKGDEQRIQSVRALGLVSYLCVPMVAHGHTFGALTLGTAESGRHYSDDDLLFAQDVASRAAMAIDNAQAYEQLDSANRLKDEFLGTLSHELRTPLNAVLGYARMVCAGTIAGDRTAHAMEIIERNATSLAEIVEDVLDVSSIVAGKTRLHLESVKLPDLVHNATATVAPAANAKSVRVQTVIDSHLSTVSADLDRLQQVVWHLLSNAVKFTPRHGRVQVRLEQIDAHAVLTVSDTGIGIAAEFLPHIFERFRQGDGSLTRRHGGLGLGLAIVRHNVEMHGGTIEAASEGEGKGATFCVKLPVMNARAAATEWDNPGRPRADRVTAYAARSPLSGVRVLAVDDDKDALALVRLILESAGASVTTKSSASLALESLDEESPDVLIADIGMPEMDGFELIEKIRGSTNAMVRDVRAAALTAYARSEDRAKTLSCGFQVHLSKPVDPAELIAAVGTLARRIS
jgi:signal transduction histidine kinase